MVRSVLKLGFAAGAALFLALPAGAGDKQVARGKYLVEFGGCNDCHTPGYFFGKPDANQYLGGSDVGFAIPGLGVFIGRNLTPDKETGLGNWTRDQIVTALTKGIRPDKRELAPIMPWRAFSKLTKSDARAIVAYLQSLPPVKHAVPGPFGPNQAPPPFVMAVLPGNVFGGLPKPPPPPGK
jgi:mono/diheme cytochrome c family protein